MKISNPLFGFLFDKFDFLIRLVYCQLPVIRSLFFWRLYKSDHDALDGRFEGINKQLAELGFSFDGKVCLEIGPGNSYFNAYNFLMMGARKVILVDKFPRILKTRRQQDFFLRELDHVQRKYGVDQLSFVSSRGPDPERIQVVIGDIAHIDITDEIDFVYSYHVLEHVKDISGTLAAMSRIMASGAIAYHAIDMRDHYNFNTPFLFYKYSTRVWEGFLTKEGISYTNRLRIDDFEVEFIKHGLDIIELDTKRYPLKSSNLDKIFLDKREEILSTGKASFLLRKR